MPKIRDNMSMHENTVQKLATGEVKIPRARRARKKVEEPPITYRRKMVRNRIWVGVNRVVYNKAMELAGKNWRRLEVIDGNTILVHNKEVH